MADSEDTPAAETKEWDLEPESEYRFELEQGVTIAVKVRPPPSPRHDFATSLSSFAVLLKSSGRNSVKA